MRLITLPDRDEEIDEIEVLLYNFADHLLSQLRAGDHCGRISESGFWAMIRGDEESARRAAPRLMSDADEALWQIDFCESEDRETIKNLLRRMDALHFHAKS